MGGSRCGTSDATFRPPGCGIESQRQQVEVLNDLLSITALALSAYGRLGFCRRSSSGWDEGLILELPVYLNSVTASVDWVGYGK